MRRIIAIAALGLALSGCASIVEGTDQSITVTVDQPGATCRGVRDGEPIFMTPAGQAVIVSKSRKNIVITCAAGTMRGQAVVESHVTTMGAAGVAIDGGLTDYMTGALNAYPPIVAVSLQ